MEQLVFSDGFETAMDCAMANASTGEQLAVLGRVRRHAAEIQAAVTRHGGANPRVFGSVARGEEREGSDVDLLIENRHLTLLRIVRLEDELEQLLGLPVDVVIDEELPLRARVRLMADVVPV